MLERHVGIAGGHFLDRLAPEAGGGEHVGLVDGRHVRAASAGDLEGELRDALHFGAAVGFGVERALGVALAFAALRTPEVDAAREFAHADHVEALFRNVAAQGREALEAGVEAGRAQVAEELVALSQGKKRAHFGTGLVRERVPLRAAHGAEQDGVGLVAGFDGFVGQRPAAGVDGGAAHEALLAGDREAESLRGGVHDLEGFGHDFGADAVAGEDGDVMCAGLHDVVFFNNGS